ncbi:MAG: Uma2 family endonuclease, partial [Pyrinomonadaceae bacterium]
MVAKIEPLLTVGDLVATPDDGNHYELIEGELFVSRAPSIPHQRIIHNLQMSIGLYLEQSQVGILVPGAGIIFSDFAAVIPDLIFVSEKKRVEIASGDKFIGAPELIIEVMSEGEGNRQRDLVVKRQLYGKYKVKEYWIIDPENRLIEIYRLQGQKLEKIDSFKDGDEITSP